METVDVTDLIYNRLPESIGNVPCMEDAENAVKSMLLEELPRSEQKSLETELKWQFVLDKHSLGKKKFKANRRKFLTRKRRLENGLLKLPKNNTDQPNWDYKNLQGMREMWQDYMRNCLDLLNAQNRVPKCDENDWQSFSANLAKCEIIGAEISVIRSKNTNLVNMSGTVVLETKETIQIVTKKSQLKILIKRESIFAFALDGKKFIFFGKHLCSRAAERSSKKIKSFMYPDL